MPSWLWVYRLRADATLLSENRCFVFFPKPVKQGARVYEVGHSCFKQREAADKVPNYNFRLGGKESQAKVLSVCLYLFLTGVEDTGL